MNLSQIMYNIFLTIKRKKSDKAIGKPQSSDQMQAFIVSPKVYNQIWVIRNGMVHQGGCCGLNNVSSKIHVHLEIHNLPVFRKSFLQVYQLR